MVENVVTENRDSKSSTIDSKSSTIIKNNGETYKLTVLFNTKTNKPYKIINEKYENGKFAPFGPQTDLDEDANIVRQVLVHANGQEEELLGNKRITNVWSEAQKRLERAKMPVRGRSNAKQMA